MLNPRLTNCPECANIPSLLKEIEYKIFELSKQLYNNTVFILNQPIDGSIIFDLLNYKRILMYKHCNHKYAEDYSINMIASKIKLLKYK